MIFWRRLWCIPDRFDGVLSAGASSTGAGEAGDADSCFVFVCRGAFTSSVASSSSGGSCPSSSVVAYVDGRLGCPSTLVWAFCFAYSFFSFAFSIRLRLIWMARGGKIVLACQGARGRVVGWVLGTFAAVGAVGKVLRADGEAFFVFLCGAVGGCIVAGPFCDCHGRGCFVV